MLVFLSAINVDWYVYKFATYFKWLMNNLVPKKPSFGILKHTQGKLKSSVK